MGWARERIFDPQWQKAVASWETKLVQWATPDWWRVPTESLTACRAKKHVGLLTAEEHESLQDWQIQGNGRIRLVGTGDPCLTNGTATFPFNAFLLVRGPEGKVTATQVINGDYSASEYGSVTLHLTEDGNRPLVVIERFSGGFNSGCNYETYWIDEKTQKPIPAFLFETPAGETYKIQSACELDRWMNADGKEPSPPLPEPELFHRGKLVKSFKAYYGSPGQGLIQRTFTWNGDRFVLDHLKRDRQALEDFRRCLKKNFGRDLSQCQEPEGFSFHCEYYNDLTLLELKTNQWDKAEGNASEALAFCYNNTPFTATAGERQAAHNYQRVMKANRLFHLQTPSDPDS